MMPLWLSIVALLVVAVMFMAWPLWRYREYRVASSLVSDEEINHRLAENVRLFREHLQELENNFAMQSIGAEQFAQLKLELERNLLDDEATIRGASSKQSSFLGLKVSIAFSVALLVAGIFLYHEFGSADDVAVQILQQEKMRLDEKDIQEGRNPDPTRGYAIIAKYKELLANDPENVQYWFLLARAHMEMEEFSQAVPAYQQVLQRDAKSPMIMAELAQAMFLRDNNQTTPPVVDLAHSALALDGKNVMALGLLGIDAFGKKQYKEAIHYWQRTVDLLGADSVTGQTLSAGIARAKQQFIQEGGQLEQLTAKSIYSIRVSVSLGDSVKASPDQTVFIYARAWNGTPMPLAIKRIKVSDLPTSIILDESMAMSPMASLATATDVEVVARISTDGTAQTKVGDWQAKQGPISMEAIPDGVQLTIDSQVKPE